MISNEGVDIFPPWYRPPDCVSILAPLNSQVTDATGGYVELTLHINVTSCPRWAVTGDAVDIFTEAEHVKQWYFQLLDDYEEKMF